MSIEKAYTLADELIDKGEHEYAQLLGAVAGLAEQRGKIIEELASICCERSSAKRLACLRRLAFDNELEKMRWDGRASCYRS